MTFNEKRCKSRNQIISEPFAMRVIFMNVKEVIRKECNAIDYCQKNFMDLSSLRPNTQVSLSDRKLTLVRHKISQAKYPVSHSFYQQFLCHFVGHVLTCFIHIHIQKSFTNTMNNFEIALKLIARREKYTESKLACLRRSTCLAWVAMNCPASLPASLPSSFLLLGPKRFASSGK